MLSWIISSSLQLRTLAAAAAVAVIGFGIFAAREMPADVFPEFGRPVVEVQTEALGLSAEEVKSLVTLNLEELLSGVPWLDSVTSQSVMSLSSVRLTFKRGTDILRARQMVQERLTLAYALPNVSSTPTLMQPLSTTSRLMMVGLRSDKIEPTELSLLARWTIKPKLVGIPGVANVAIWGQRLQEMQVQVDPQRLRDARLIQDDVIAAVGDSLWITPLSFLKGSSPGTGGFIDNPNQRLGVHHKMPITEPEDMAEIPVVPQHLLLTGRKMSLGEVAEVTHSHSLMIGDAYVHGGPGLLLVVEKFPSANTIEVTKAVEKALAELKRGLPGVELDATTFRLATYIDSSFENLSAALAIGAALVTLVVGLFLFSWRGASIAAVAVVASLAAALLILAWTGATLNTMLIAGLFIALTVLIDDAIVDIQRIRQDLAARSPGGPSTASMILQTTLDTRRTTTFAAAAALLAITPIFFIGGMAGALFEPLASAYALAVVASVVIGFTVTPALAQMLFGEPSAKEGVAGGTGGGAYAGVVRRLSEAPGLTLLVAAFIFASGGVSSAYLQEDILTYTSLALAVILAIALFSWILASAGASQNAPFKMPQTVRDRYGAAMRSFTSNPRVAVLSVAALIVAGALVAPTLGRSLLPTLQERDIVVDLAAPPGTSHAETFRIVSRVSGELETLPQVRGVSAHIGRAVTGDQVVGINSGQIWVGLKPGADFEEAVAAAREVVDGYPGVDRSVRAYLRDTLGEALTGAATPVVVRVFGQDRAVMRDLAEHVRRSLSGVDGLVDLRIVGEQTEPQVRVAVDLEAAAAAHVNPGEVRRSSSTVFSGLNAGFLYEDQKIYDVRVWSPPEVRRSIPDVEDVLVEKSDRHSVRLGEIAKVDVTAVPTVIKHFGVAPYVDVVAGVAGQDLGAVALDVERKLEQVKFPLEYRAELLGEFVERKGGHERVVAVAIAALAGIFLLLQACFGSWRLAGIAFLTLPAAAAGGVLAVTLSGGDVSLGAIIGFLAALALAVRQSILLLRHYQRLEQAGVPFGAELVAQASQERLAPILASAAATIVLMAPILLYPLAPGLEIVRPTAIVIVGGVVASTLVTLLIVPALYLGFGADADRQSDLGLADA